MNLRLTLRPYLVQLHRWIALVLAPLFLLLTVTGILLSFRPILADLGTPPRAQDPAALVRLIDTLDQGGIIRSVKLIGDGSRVDIAASRPDVAGIWEIASGQRLADSPPDIMMIAEQLHKSLMLGLGWLVDTGTWAMLAVLLVAPFLAWLRFRNSLWGWHLAMGWCLLPLSILSVLTAIFMTLDIGKSGAPLPRTKQPVTLASALAQVGPDLSAARKFRGGSVLVTLAGPAKGMVIVTDAGPQKMAGGPGWSKSIHEGLWGGVWSGLLNALTALALTALTITGLWSWLRRQRRRSRIKTA